ncbi:Zinc finger and BTB domain-containing protein 17 [Colletotrichum siamense]|uniref:Zinc finger and BTB domain-containing protein 17 n=1 Tax=Colletotrichum siamense TaxID=690259 RepID=UPI001872F23B|nr:Zinc finger and BTB domain-containing protein 17 [Colletotrichum siamense]KAF4805740.1 Zinc finger and BTB domain-containing protein 17 [Colletotrichum siamense]KAF5482796.1 Zinc finger and BTB domain-containing protein 17 [Colletotrichum siamense]
MSRRQIPPTLRTTRSPCTPDSLLAPTGRRFRSQIACMDSSSNNIPLDAQPSSPPGAASNSRPLASAPDSVALAPSDVLVASPITQQDQPASHLILASAPADRDDAAAAGLYQCPHCQRQYSRPAYLARHIRTYTFGKRCACPVCSKAFARTDLLKRHVARHARGGQDHGSKRNHRPGPSPSTRRVSYACRQCAAARVKCDEVKPCSRCCSRNIDCEPSSGRLSSTAAMHLTPPRDVCNTGGSWTQRSPDCLATPAPLHSHNNHSSWVAQQELSPPQQTACLTTDASSLATLGQHAEAGDGGPVTLTTWRAGLPPDAAHVIHEMSTYGWFATTGPVSNTMGRGVYEPEMGSVTVLEPETQPVSDLYASSSSELYVASLELFEAFKQPSLSGTNSADSQSWAWPADDAVDTM